MTVYGRDPPESVTPQEELREGERLRGRGVWEGDMYGAGEVLNGKREARGWKREMIDEVLKALKGEEREEVRGLLEWKGGEDGRTIYPGSLPWDKI